MAYTAEESCSGEVYRGRIPASFDLGGVDAASKYDPKASPCTRADEETEPFPKRLTFLGVEEGKVCFTYREDDTLQPELPDFQKRLEDAGVWVAAVPSLAVLKGPVRQHPPGAAAKWSVSLFDAEVNRTTKKTVVEDVTFEKTTTSMFFEFKLCAGPFSPSPDAHFLVLVGPAPSYGSTYQPPDHDVMSPDGRYDAYREHYPWSSASLLVWELVPE